MKVYISGALTGIKEIEKLKKLYCDIGQVCSDLGLKPYIPHLYTDPVLHADVAPQEVFKKDKEQTISSDLIIAYVDYSSLGVGMEIAYAEMYKIPVILLYQKDHCVSRFPRGIPNLLAEVQFDNYEDALVELKTILRDFLYKSPVKPKISK